MKRTVPLLITALGGFVLIIAYFIPATEGWGEVAAVWFDVLAAIAFVLGGGNLLKVHLQKASDRTSGWGYSVVVLVAFLVMLFVGLTKFASPPAPIQEYYGEKFASLPLDAFPQSQLASVPGSIPAKDNREPLAASVRAQIAAHPERGEISFRGWMRRNQRNDLLGYKDELEWKCTVARLFKAAQPPTELAGKAIYYADHEALSFKGSMTAEQRQMLLDMSDDAAWQNAVTSLYDRTQAVTSVTVESWPGGVEIPESLRDVVTYDPGARGLSIKGPMSPEQRDALAKGFQFPIARPLNDQQRADLLARLRSLGPIEPEQVEAFDKVLAGTWTAELLATTLNDAGRGERVEKTACEMLEERQAALPGAIIEPKRPAEPDVTLTDQQRGLLEAFAADQDMEVADLIARLRTAGDFTAKQATALETFMSRQPTVGERNKAMAFAMLRDGPLNQNQRDELVRDYAEQMAWRKTVGDLYIAAHQVKYPWSGEYRAQGSPFWWLYEYAFKPLTATMFAMLAFYVASAAFRAFRAKNFEAILLLGTAFIILLGRTFAGVWLTSWIDHQAYAWMPEWLAGLRIENLTIHIMSIFNTAGNRAIMIGIALGIASTSLKVLLGVDRSYLGKE